MSLTSPTLPSCGLALLVLLGGCEFNPSVRVGGDGGEGDAAPEPPDATPTEASYFPLAVGATWEYKVTENGMVGTKVQTILALEDVGGIKAGITAYKFQSIKPSGKKTLSWQEDTGDTLLRHREQTFAANQTQQTEEFYLPGKLRLDETPEHLVLGASFPFSYDEQVENLAAGTGVATLSKSETWTVEAVDVTVMVPAGTFLCIQLRKFNAASGSDKRYWFSRGVGKVREAGAGQLEELASYQIP